MLTWLCDQGLATSRLPLTPLAQLAACIHTSRGEHARGAQVADFGMREELVLKTAVLAERFYPDLRWYVDVMLQLMERAGEFASKDHLALYRAAHHRLP